MTASRSRSRSASSSPMPSPSTPPPPAPDDLAAVVHRVAVLLGAGVAPAVAWRHAAGARPPAWAVAVAAAPDGVDGALLRLAAHAPPARSPAGGGPGRRGATAADAAALAALAAIWRVASVSGAPMAPTLRAAAASLRAVAAARRAAAVAMAGPAATMRLVVAMPPVALLVGVALGYDTLGVLVGTPIGWACLVLGGGLLVAARAWGRRLVDRAGRADPMPGLAAELLAVAMGGGAALDRARALVIATLRDCGLADDPAASLAAADDAVAVAGAAGAPIAELLRAEADDARRAAAAVAAERAAVLETALMVPLGVCVLPAFVLLGVVPVLLAVMASAVQGW